jgi:putative transposase
VQSEEKQTEPADHDLEKPFCSLSSLTETERNLALERFRLIRPYLEDGVPLARVVQDKEITVRTAQRWVKQYHRNGLAGLVRKARADKEVAKSYSRYQQIIEGYALQKPRLSAAAIYRKVIAFAAQLGERPPSYSTVYASIKQMEPSLITLAHEGSRAYSDSFDLIHRRESEAPNAMWQADHTELDVWITCENGEPKKPWLTIILDDYSRAVAGYSLSFNAPSAIHTALALRQAIWRKESPGWHVCGIPEVLYTDHGSDFTSRHLEQVAVELKIRLVFSGVRRPRGRGKIERFFETLSQVFLSRLPGFSPKENGAHRAKLRLSDLARELELFLVKEYHLTPHSTTKEPPQARWDGRGFLPQMPVSLEQLDLLLLTVAKERSVHQDGIRFSGYRYIDPTLAAYVGEKVILRYDPRDMAEVRVYFQDRFLCRAVCQELAGETVALRDIIRARNHRRRELRQTIEERRRLVDSLLEARQWTATPQEASPPDQQPTPETPKLKRYFNE